MDERRKRTLGVIAAIFASRKLAALEGKPLPAREVAFKSSIDLAEELMRRIDRRWPAKSLSISALALFHFNHLAEQMSGNRSYFTATTTRVKSS
jgi:hypothetical protein